MISAFRKNLIMLLLALFASGAMADASLPKFDLQSLSGKSIDLDHYVGKGKWTLVMFWATDCRICRDQKPAVSAFHDKHQSGRAQVVGVAVDGYAKITDINAYLADGKTTFPTLVGELPIVAMNYEMLAQETFRGTPTYWLFKPDGALVGVNPGAMNLDAVETFMDRYSEASSVKR